MHSHVRLPPHPRWNALCLRVGAFKNAQETELTFDMVKTLYTHPPRAYHNLAHIEQVLGEFDQVFRLADDRDAVEMALWLHDCVYIAARPDNEERSADGRWHQPRTNLKRATDRGSERAIWFEVQASGHRLTELRSAARSMPPAVPGLLPTPH